ncbi:unnamed protein product [Urochloa humidicola]
MRRRVVPPTSFHGRVPEHLLIAEQVDMEEACTGGMDLGYYTDLLVNGEEQPQDLTPPTDPTIQHARATAKNSQGRSKNFREEEDILLMSGLRLGTTVVGQLMTRSQMLVQCSHPKTRKGGSLSTCIAGNPEG